MRWKRVRQSALRPLGFLATVVPLLLFAACGSVGGHATPTAPAGAIAPPLLWQSATSLPPKTVSLRFAASQARVGYACAQNTGAKDFDPKPFIFRTDDGGQTWAPIATPFSTALDGPCDVWVDPSDSNDVLVARAPQRSTDGIKYLSVLSRSRDGGKTWKALAPVVASTRYSVMFAAIVGSRVFAFLDRFLDAQKTPNQLYVSADGGATWKQIGQQFNFYTVMASGSALIVGSGEVAGARPTVSSAGTRTARFDLPLSGDPPPVSYYASTNGGATWAKMSLPYLNVQPVVFTPGADGALLGLGQALHAPPSALPQFILTRDGGANWTTLPPLTTAPGTDPTITPLSRDNLALLPDGTVFVSTTIGRAGGPPSPTLWRLAPGETAWKPLASAPATMGQDGVGLWQFSQVQGAGGATMRLWGWLWQDAAQRVYVDITA